MNNVTKKILALLMSIVMVLSLTACDAAVEDVVNGVVDDAKGQINQAVDDAKDKLEDMANDAIQGAADSAKDKVNDWLNPGGSNSGNAVTSIPNSKISITMLDVGQGLSILVESNGEYMLYDGGDRGTSSYVVSYLDKHGVDHLDYMIASHYDSDHLAGLVGVLETTSVDTIINPDFEATTKIYDSYVSKRDASGADVIYPSIGDTYDIGYSTFTILAPARDYGDANEISVAIKIECGDFSCVITGDAEGESEADMVASGIDLNCDLYVVGHHGSSSSSAEAFVKAMSPDYGFISCGADNDYGHPTDKTLNTLNKYGVQYYRSDIDGEVTCVSDGKDYAFTKSLTQKSVGDVDGETEANSATASYILNTNSLKFHYPDCSSAAKISEKNKEVFDGSREELIKSGYEPCGYCDP